MDLAYFRFGDAFPEGEEIPGHNLTSYSSLDAFVAAGEKADGIIIGSDDSALSEHCIRRIRSTPATSLAPVFLLKSLGPRMALLTDGEAPTIQAAVARMEPFVARMREIPVEILEQGQDFRLLGYLYARPEMLLTTYRHWQHAGVHSYPVAEVLADPSTVIERWLSNLEDRRYLERVELLDRLRLCPKCGGCHHNFVDACPRGRSIDIVRKPFLHCFTCGHVAPEESFLTRGSLVCPNCLSRLRHIGADYDRPLENYVCSDCGQSFVEPLVIARCLSCGAENDPESLVPRQVYSFRLGERGALAARTGSLEDIYALFDNLNYIRPQFFEALLDWLMAVCRRHSEELFSLIGIRLRNILELTDSIGRYRTSELVDEFAFRLREAIRKTDLTTRTSQRTLWILLPKTDCPACRILVDRFEDIRQHTRQAEGVEIEYDIVTFSAPEKVPWGHQPHDGIGLERVQIHGSLHGCTLFGRRPPQGGNS
jgi:GGDEF domain-containing protein